MNGRQAIDGLHLHDDLAVDQKIQAIATIDPYVAIDHGKRFLALRFQATLDQLKSEAGLICRLQETWAQGSMHLDGSTDHTAGDRV